MWGRKQDLAGGCHASVSVQVGGQERAGQISQGSIFLQAPTFSLPTNRLNQMVIVKLFGLDGVHLVLAVMEGLSKEHVRVGDGNSMYVYDEGLRRKPPWKLESM